MAAAPIIVPTGNPQGGEHWAPGHLYPAVYRRNSIYNCTIVGEPTGGEFVPGATCSFGDDDKIKVSNVEVDALDKRKLRVKITVASDAPLMANTGSISVTNPDGSSDALKNCFSIVEASAVPTW